MPQTPYLGTYGYKVRKGQGDRKGEKTGGATPLSWSGNRTWEGKKERVEDTSLLPLSLACMAILFFFLLIPSFPSLGAKPKSEEDFLSAINVYPFPES